MINNIEELKTKVNEYKDILVNIPMPISQYDKNNLSVLLNKKIYFGSYYHVSKNISELKKCGITHIINITERQPNLFEKDFKYITYRISDSPFSNLYQHFDDIIKIILNITRNKGVVYVHCAMGISRTAAVLIAFVGKILNIDFVKAYKYVYMKRPCIKPNMGLCVKLIEYLDKKPEILVD
jgi:protein-tyrosine phosphatase